MDGYEWINHKGQVLALIIHADYTPRKTEFITPDPFVQQAGFVVYPAGGVISAHIHKPIPRTINGTPEALVIRSGKMEASFFTEEHELVATRLVKTGDVVFLVSGGHGFEVLEDTILLEIKQGPYTGLQEKERFQ